MIRDHAIFQRLLNAASRTTRRKRFFAGAAILAAALLLSFLLIATGPDPLPEPVGEKAWPVSVISVEPEDLAPVFSTYGRVESNNIAELRTNVSAEVARVNVREGQWVQADELLVELRRDELALLASEKEADLAQAQAQLKSIETEFELLRQTSSHYESVWTLSQKKLERQQGLLEQRMIPQAMMDDAVQAANQATIAYQAHVRAITDLPNRIAEHKAVVARAEALWQQALLNLERAQIRAPFAGPVLAVSVAAGDYSSRSEALVVLADASEFVIRAPVPNRYVPLLRTALRDGRPLAAEAQIEGIWRNFELERLSSDVKSGQSGLDAFFPVPQAASDARLLPEIGRILNLRVSLPTMPGVVALPVQSIYENDRVYQVVDDRLQAITVERVGEYQTVDGQYRVLVRGKGLEQGHPIITTQLPRAISGLLVAPANVVEPPLLAQKKQESE